MLSFVEMNSKPLNILVINHDWRNIFETSFHELYDKLERDRVRPDLNNFFFASWANVAYVKKRDERFASVHIKTMWKSFKPMIDFLSIFVVPFVVWKSKFKPDVIFFYDLGFVLPARILKLLYGSKVVLCLNNMPEVYSKTRRFGLIKGWYSFFLERLFVGLVDIGYTLNATMKRYLLDMGLPESKIRVFAMNTIERDRLHIDSAHIGEMRKKYGIRDDQKVILCVGRLETEKGYPRLFEVFSKLDKNSVLMVLGRGSLLEEFKEKTKMLGIAERVIFCGFIHREEIWNYYKDADVFVLLSNAEALGVVFWEAMYVRVPVVGSMAPGIVETLGNDGNRGRLVEENEPLSLIKEKINFCLHPSAEKEAMLDRARIYVEEQIQNGLTVNDLV